MIISMQRLITFLILFFLLASFIGFGCAKKEESIPKEPLRLLSQVLEEQKKQPLGKYGFIERWKIKDVSYDEINGQVIAELELETSEYFLFLKADMRKKGKGWFIYGLRKEDSLSRVDLEEPYRYWFRRFVFSTSLH
jgi:hypothetical protein